MENPSIFTYKGYRDFLKAKIAENSHIKAFQTKLAAAAGCQKSFISKVLNGPIQLTPDHALGIAQFFNLDADQVEYFLELVQLERANTQALKIRTETRLSELKQKQNHLARRLKSEEWSSPLEKQTTYYSTWFYAAIHMATGISELQTVKNIAHKLKIPEPVVESALNFLSETDLVHKVQGRWIRSEHAMHLSKDSNLNLVNQVHWRNKSMAAMQNQISTNIHYSGVFTLSEKDFEKLKEMCIRFLEQKRKIVMSSKDEKLTAMCVDFFEL